MGEESFLSNPWGWAPLPSSPPISTPCSSFPRRSWQAYVDDMGELHHDQGLHCLGRRLHRHGEHFGHDGQGTPGERKESACLSFSGAGLRLDAGISLAPCKVKRGAGRITGIVWGAKGQTNVRVNGKCGLVWFVFLFTIERQLQCGRGGGYSGFITLPPISTPLRDIFFIGTKTVHCLSMKAFSLSTKNSICVQSGLETWC